jgi:RHS repeat-associated protein
MVDGIGSTAYAYDTVGQVLSEDGPWPNDTVSYSYANRLRTSLSVQAPNATAWSQNANYTYDNAGEVASVMALSANGVTNRAQEMANYTYDGAGNMSLKRVIISTTDKIYYHVNALNEITNTTFGGPNGLGAWTAMTTVAGWASPTATNVTVNGSTARLYEDKTYATNGILVSPGNNTFTAVAKDALNRTAAYTSSVNIFTNNSAYLYDTNGNLLYDGYRGFAYDDENQLISVWLTNVWRSDFAYDGKMRRRIEKDYSWTASSWLQTNTTYFVYDGNLVVQERNASYLPAVTYTRGQDLSGTFQGAGGIGGLLARTDMGQWIEGSTFAHALYHADGNGNITCLIYPNQSIAAKYLYDAFGATLGEYGSLADANAYRFSSKEWNANAAVYYYLYRFYDPNLQRWPNRDPLGEIGFETLHLVTQPLFIRKLRLNINDSEMQYFLAMAMQSGSINMADYLRNAHTPYAGDIISALAFFNLLRSGQGNYAPNWPVELLEYSDLFGFVGNDPIDDLDPNGLWNPFKAIWNWLMTPPKGPPPSSAPTSCSIGYWGGYNSDPQRNNAPPVLGFKITVYPQGQ